MGDAAGTMPIYLLLFILAACAVEKPIEPPTSASVGTAASGQAQADAAPDASPDSGQDSGTVAAKDAGRGVAPVPSEPGSPARSAAIAAEIYNGGNEHCAVAQWAEESIDNPDGVAQYFADEDRRLRGQVRLSTHHSSATTPREYNFDRAASVAAANLEMTPRIIDFMAQAVKDTSDILERDIVMTAATTWYMLTFVYSDLDHVVGATSGLLRHKFADKDRLIAEEATSVLHEMDQLSDDDRKYAESLGIDVPAPRNYDWDSLPYNQQPKNDHDPSHQPDFDSSYSAPEPNNDPNAAPPPIPPGEASELYPGYTCELQGAES